MARTSSNAQPHKPCDELSGSMADAVTSFTCSFDVNNSISFRGYKNIKLNSAEHEILNTHKNKKY